MFRELIKEAQEDVLSYRSLGRIASENIAYDEISIQTTADTYTVTIEVVDIEETSTMDGIDAFIEWMKQFGQVDVSIDTAKDIAIFTLHATPAEPEGGDDDEGEEQEEKSKF